MKKSLIITTALAILIIGYQFGNNSFAYPSKNNQKAISKCVEKLDKLTDKNVAACYHKNMPKSTLDGSKITDQYGYDWDFTIKGTCTPDDDCRAHVSKGKIGFDILLWYDMPKNRK